MTALKKLAVIGDPIDHSLSPKIHKIFAESSGLAISYEAIQVEKKDFRSAVTSLFDSGYAGLNVTLPLKEDAFNYANKLSEESKLSGSVNTLWKEDSFICADTTDGRGLVKDLISKNISLSNLEIVILGAGGSARAIIPSLLKEKPGSITIANRTFSKAEQLARKIFFV
jgi:shikimate dehydrogenase